MPLRDHFRGPVFKLLPWETLHAMWPGAIVQRLNAFLPPQYSAAPGVHAGASVAVDVAAFDRGRPAAKPPAATGNGSAWQPGAPTLTLEAEALDLDAYEVRVYDRERELRLVAAIELVSPANKDRPENRAAFVAKCAALAQQCVSVVVVDVVTTRGGSLYGELLRSLDKEDPAMGDESLYAAALRRVPESVRLENWAHRLELGAGLPTLPLWLAEDLAVPLELEASYEDACRALRIP